MKTHDEMYQSVLSRFDEYQKQKKKRLRIIKMATPAVACFGLAIAFGIGYYAKFAKLPEVSVTPPVSEASVAETSVTETTTTTVASVTDSSTVSRSDTRKSEKTDKKTVPTTVSGYDEQTKQPPSNEAYPPRLIVTTAPNTSSGSSTVHTTVSHKVTEKVSTVTSAKQTSKRTTAAETTAPIITTTVTSGLPETITEPKPTTDLSQKEIVYEDADGKLKVLYSKDSNIDLKRFKVMSKDTSETYNSSANAEPPDGSSEGGNDDNDLFTMDKQEALRRIETMERITIGEYLRARAIVNGELSADAPRLDLEQTNEIIAGSDSFNEIYQKLQAVQPIPDYIGGSGFSKVEYWFDNKGEEKILLVLEEEDVVYIHLNNYNWIVR